MDLALAITVGGGEVLRGVAFSTSAVAAGIATDPSTDTKAAADERAVLLEQPFDLLVVLLGGLHQALPESAGALAHGDKPISCWHTRQGI